MPNWIKKSLKVVIALAVGALIIWLSVRELSPEDKSEIFNVFRATNYWWIIASLVLAFISNISRSIRWEQLLKPMGYQPRFINVMLSVLVAYFANLGLPRLGEVARCGTLRTYDNIPLEKSFGTVVTERFLDLLVFGTLFIVNLLLQFKTIHTYVEKEIFDQFNISLSGTIIVLGSGFVAVVILFFSFRKKIQTLSIYKKVAHIIEGFLDGIKSILKVEKPLMLIFHSLFIWFCYWMMAYLIFQSLPVTAHLGMMEALSVLTIGTVGMIVVQGGLGIYPLLIAGTLVVYGLSYPTAYAMGWLLWGSQTIGIIISGIVALIIIPHLNKNK